MKRIFTSTPTACVFAAATSLGGAVLPAAFSDRHHVSSASSSPLNLLHGAVSGPFPRHLVIAHCSSSNNATITCGSTICASSSFSSMSFCEQRRAQSSSHISPSAIANVKKGTPAISFTPYKVFHVVCKHDPKLRGRQGPQLMAIVYNRFQRLTGSELAVYKRSAAKLNRLRTLASQRLLLSSIVLRRFGVENYRRIYPNSSVTVGSASRAARKMLQSTYPPTKRRGEAAVDGAKKKQQRGGAKNNTNNSEKAKRSKSSRSRASTTAMRQMKKNTPILKKTRRVTNVSSTGVKRSKTVKTQQKKKSTSAKK